VDDPPLLGTSDEFIEAILGESRKQGTGVHGAILRLPDETARCVEGSKGQEIRAKELFMSSA